MPSKLIHAVEIVIVTMLASLPVLALMVFFYGLFMIVFPSPSCGAEYIGRMSSNPFVADSCSNPFSSCGNPFSPSSPNNPFGPYGNPYSPYSENNPFAVDSPSLYGHADE
jgi:hypothetical protein